MNHQQSHQSYQAIVPESLPRPCPVRPPGRSGPARQRDHAILVYQKGYNIPSPSDHDRAWLRARHQPGWDTHPDRARRSAEENGGGFFDGPGTDLVMVLQFNACRRNTGAARDVIVSTGLPVLAGSSPIRIWPGVPFPTRAARSMPGAREEAEPLERRVAGPTDSHRGVGDRPISYQRAV
jgi:hypothetical protein